MSLSLIANTIAFSVLLLSGLYELFLGKYFFDKRVESGKTEVQSFLIGQKYRGNISYIVLFLMSISMMLAITSTWKESEMSDGKKSGIEFKIDDISLRLKRVEDFIWPPTPGGDKPIDPTGGPDGPPFSPMNFGEIVDRLKNLEGRMGFKDANDDEIRKVWRELSQLRAELEAYNETVEALKKLMPAPAG